MTTKAAKLLERMRQSTTGWKCSDLLRLYSAYGFDIIHGSSHDIIKHPLYPQFRTTLPRHNKLARGYVENAVKMIDRLLEEQKENRHEPPTS